MDLKKVKNDEKLSICRFYYRAGFCLLPLVWLVNAAWFFKEGFVKPPYEEQKQIRKYVIHSAIGALIWAVVVATWVTVFQTHRVSWGELGDELSCLIPTGEP
ncbi:gamma-secretase subunit PEN-2 [Cimex lectularius]|uniref:Gamma-secretase subunit PEN-2 n=1 Tax=Cimex lectularius TaxID=79782 RepID=A0A8I6RQG0_CIMLE|nr:gamma-secretase subunit PEN-2 [Cimex lectularius]